MCKVIKESNHNSEGIDYLYENRDLKIYSHNMVIAFKVILIKCVLYFHSRKTKMKNFLEVRVATLF